MEKLIFKETMFYQEFTGSNFDEIIEFLEIYKNSIDGDSVNEVYIKNSNANKLEIIEISINCSASKIVLEPGNYLVYLDKEFHSFSKKRIEELKRYEVIL